MKRQESSRTRRDWLRQAPAGLALAASAPARAGQAAAVGNGSRLPREIWVASVSQEGLGAGSSEQMIRAVLARMEETAPYQPDIVCTPEVFAFSNVSGGPRALAAIAEKPIGPVCEPFAAFAKKHHCYVVCSTYTQDNGRFYNAAVLLDRAGQVAGEYRKIHPTVGEMEDGVCPGPVDPPVFRTDIGVIGFQICFDINWPEGWRKLRKAGAEIVFWPSAFGGGSMLNALAWQNKYCVVSSTRKGITKMCDIGGEEIASTGWMRPWLCAPVNLDKAFIHAWPFNRHHKAIQAKYGRGVRIKVIHENEWTIMESRSPDIRIADVLKEFGIPTHEEFIAQSDAAQDARRKA